MQTAWCAPPIPAYLEDKRLFMFSTIANAIAVTVLIDSVNLMNTAVTSRVLETTRRTVEGGMLSTCIQVSLSCPAMNFIKSFLFLKQTETIIHSCTTSPEGPELTLVYCNLQPM